MRKGGVRNVTRALVNIERSLQNLGRLIGAEVIESP